MGFAVCTLLHMSNDRDRVISVTLSEAEWQALVARHPQPHLWLRERIRAEVVDAQEESEESAA